MTRTESAGILIVIDTLGPSGAELQLASITERLASAGLRMEVAALMPPYTLAERFESQGIRVHRLDLSHRWALLPAIRRLRRLCVDRHIGTLWATLYFSSVYSSAVRALLPNRRLIHWLQSPGYTNPLYRGIWPDIRAAIHGWACRRADVLVACSKAVAADYEGCFNLPPIRVIYGGVNDEALPSPISVTDRSETRRRYGVSDDAKLITIAARYSIDKGHSTLLGALQLLKDRHGIRPMCIAAGQGVLLDSLRTETAERGLDAQVRFVGSLPQPELFRLMQSSDVVAMPSLQEALGLAAMEAMALGTPLVVSDYYGLAELAAGGAAFRADVGSAASLAEALRQALGDSEERIRVCEAARRRIQESFVVSKISMQWKSTLTNAS